MQKNIDIVRAWRDEEYRNSLTAAELASLPASPAGVAAVDDGALRSINGGMPLWTRAVESDCTTFVGSCVKPGQQCP